MADLKAGEKLRQQVRDSEIGTFTKIHLVENVIIFNMVFANFKKMRKRQKPSCYKKYPIIFRDMLKFGECIYIYLHLSLKVDYMKEF